MIIVAVIISILAIVFLWVLKSVKNLSLKITTIICIAAMIAATTFICIATPVMHKPFSINVIEYLIKINDDGSVSTTQKTTQTVIQKKQNNQDNSKRRNIQGR